MDDPKIWAAILALLPTGFLLSALLERRASRRWANLCLGLGLFLPVYVDKLFWVGGPILQILGLLRMTLAAIGLVAGLRSARLRADGDQV